MISHLKLRLAASALTLTAVLHPHVCAARPTAQTDAGVTLPHISITTIGRGSPVVLIPGLASPRAVWDGVAPRIARDHRVILVQVNGFAGDDPGANLKPGLLDGAVADLHGWLAANHMAHPAVIGHSMGGLLALMLAKAHPEDASKLMIVDSLPFFGTVFTPAATVPMLAPQAAAMRDQMAAQYGKPDDPAAHAAVAARLALTPGARTQVAGWGARADPRVTAEAMYEDLSTDLRPDIAGFAAPVTVVYPYSELTPEATARAIYHTAYDPARKVTYVEVPASGHFVMLDQPAAFVAAVDAFLQ